MKKRIFVNRQIVAQNRKYGTNKPPITVRSYNKTIHCHYVVIEGPSILMHRPKKPLHCGARVWLETEAEVKTR